MAAPHLMPGRNRVTVNVANPPAVKAQPLTVVYRYKEAPGWTDLKVIEKQVPRCPFTFDAELPETAKLPQMQDLTIRCGQLNWVPPKKVSPNRVVFNFARRAAMQNWRADAAMKLSHDGVGMVLAVAGKATYPQASVAELKEDWSEYGNLVIELENLRDKPQEVVFRVRSNKTNDERTDVQQRVEKGKAVFRIPIAGLRKTKVDAITRIYLMTYDVPETGCKIRVTKIYLEPRKQL